VSMYRELAERNPSAFNGNLADSLWALSYCRSSFRENEEALTAMQESTRLYETLAEKYPVAFDDKLARSLDVLRFCLNNVGRTDEAQRVEQKADAIKKRTRKGV